jgi:hypothetical protein
MAEHHNGNARWSKTAHLTARKLIKEKIRDWDPPMPVKNMP